MIDQTRFHKDCAPAATRRDRALELLSSLRSQISAAESSYEFSRALAPGHDLDVKVLITFKRFATLGLTLPFDQCANLHAWANSEPLRQVLEEIVDTETLFASSTSDMFHRRATEDATALPRTIIGHALPLVLGSHCLDHSFRTYWLKGVDLDWFFAHVLNALIWFGIMLDQRFREPLSHWERNHSTVDFEQYVVDVDYLFDEEAVNEFFLGWSKEHATLVKEDLSQGGVEFTKTECALPRHEDDVRAQIVRFVLGQVDNPVQRWQLLYPYWHLGYDLDLTLATTLVSLPGIGVRLQPCFIQPTLQWISTCRYANQIAELCDLQYAFDTASDRAECPVLRRIVKP